MKDRILELYDRGLDNFALPFTYWGWKFIAGSWGDEISPPWTARICIYFWPVLSLFCSPFVAFVAWYYFGTTVAILALLLAPPTLTAVIIFYVARLVFGRGPVYKIAQWANNSKTLHTILITIFFIVILGFISIMAVVSIWTYYVDHGLASLLWVSVFVAAGIVALVFLGLAVVFAGGFIEDSYKSWRITHPRKVRVVDTEPRKPARWARVLSTIGNVIVAILAFAALPFVLVHAQYKEHCPIKIYEEKNTSES